MLKFIIKIAHTVGEKVKLVASVSEREGEAPVSLDGMEGTTRAPFDIDMSLRQYVIFMLAGTVLCWVAFGLVVMNLNPIEASWPVFVFFYLTLFLALVGTFALLGMAFRLFILRHEVVFRQVMIAYRQAFSFSFIVVMALFLQSQHLLFWWSLFLLVGALTFVEFAVLLRQRRLPPV